MEPIRNLFCTAAELHRAKIIHIHPPYVGEEIGLFDYSCFLCVWFSLEQPPLCSTIETPKECTSSSEADEDSDYSPVTPRSSSPSFLDSIYESLDPSSTNHQLLRRELKVRFFRF